MSRPVAFGLGLLLVAGVAAAAEGEAAEPSPAEAYFGNVELITQEGKAVRLYRDLLADKVVVIDTFYTTCTGICPVMSRSFAAVQEMVGDRLGRDVHLLSISVDPENDTPDKLKSYAARFKARPGWYFLTGAKENVDQALFKLGQYVEDKESHQGIIVIGNLKTGLWKKAFGLAPTEELLQVVQSVLDDRDPEAEGRDGGGDEQPTG